MEFNENKPIYLQLADQLMDLTESSDYYPESRIPSVREFAAQVGVNPNTVMRTYTWLQEKGIIYNRRGVGYFFSADAKEIIQRRRVNEFFDKDLPEFVKKMVKLQISVVHFDNLFKRYHQLFQNGKL